MYKRYPKRPASLRFEMGSQMGTPQKSASFCNLIWRHSRCKELACGRSNTSATTLPVPLTDYDMNGNSRCCKYRHLALWWKAWQAKAASARMTWGGRILAKHCQALSGPLGQPLERVSESKKWKSDDAMDTWRTDVSKLSPCHFLSGQVQKVRLLWILGRKFCHGHWSISIDIAAKKMGPAWGFFEVRSSSKVKLAALSTMNITHTHGMSHSWVRIYSSSYQCSVLSSVSTIWEFQLDIGRWPLNVHILAIFARFSWHACGNKWPHQASGQTTSTSAAKMFQQEKGWHDDKSSLVKKHPLSNCPSEHVTKAARKMSNQTSLTSGHARIWFSIKPKTMPMDMIKFRG